MKLSTTTIIAAAIGLAASSHAQIVEKKSLDLEGAKKAIAATVDYAKKNNAPGGVIALADEGGNQMALERLDGTFATGATISVGKARTAVLFKKPTRCFEELINKGRTATTAVDGFTPLIGGIPIMVDGQVVGVSGAASAAQDEELAIAGANAIAPTSAPKAAVDPAQTNPAVAAQNATFVGRKDVDAAFAKDGTLAETPGYKVKRAVVTPPARRKFTPARPM